MTKWIRCSDGEWDHPNGCYSTSKQPSGNWKLYRNTAVGREYITTVQTLAHVRRRVERELR